MLIRIDETSLTPIYAQIAAAIRREIGAQNLGPGDRLPTARDLASGLGVNVHTVLRAYQDLRDEDLVDLRRRRGAIVVGDARRAAHLDALKAYVDAASRAGMSAEEAAELVKGRMK